MRAFRLWKPHWTLARTLASAAKPKKTDIFIVGGGPAGLTLAAAIKTSPYLSTLTTTLVDAGDLKGKTAQFYHEPPEKFTNRVISLTSQSRKFLEDRVGVELMQDRLQAFDGLYVSDGCSDAGMEMERDSMGHMIEILNIQSSLLHRLSQLKASNLNLVDQTKVVNIEHKDPKDPQSWLLVTLSNGDVFETRLLVGCDGFNSPVRKFSKIESRGWFYNRFGVVATMKLDFLPFKTRGWQRFLPTGPIAHLPLPGDNATLVWSTTEPLSRLLVSIDPEQLALLVNAAFVLEDVDMQYYYKQLEQGTITTQELELDINHRTDLIYGKLGNESLIDEIYPPLVSSIDGTSRGRFPLKLSHADSYVADRIALVGDAAHTTHPLAGQGLNMGQGDVESLVKALESASKRGLDLGSLLTLEPYWADRYPYNNMLLGVVDKLHKLYSTDFGPVVAVRSMGLKALQALGPIKDFMMARVSGPSQ
ncbi:LANO_0G02674g1_1 [Lachancea nothofagi CBS 11611]|uniref:Ubiquinone biosynthesis monooxygenase COQ6, mitochondrial n=1 Tax=Lachancea nothofagi CBS 11611 TaxID=1266666 RepID=A0A1G4KF51_9SACH|nr:LANO_0G02674g1_1 [Lachancea nothofagi CBS 11611]